MIEIGILEIFHHWDSVYIFSRVCKTKNSNVTIFTTPEIYFQLKRGLKDKINEYNFHIKEKKESKRSFLKKVEKICNEKIDLLFINTIPHDGKQWMKFLSFKPRCKQILNVHEIKHWMNPTIIMKISNPIGTMNNNIKAVFRKILLPRYVGINLMYPPMKKYLDEYNMYDKPVFTIGFLCEKPIKTLDEKIVNIIIHGRIKDDRGDYKGLLDVFEKLFLNYKNFSLTLLGYPIGNYGIQIINRCKKLKKQGYKIKWFESFIDLSDWEENFKKANLAICPIEVKVKIMGKYIGSGIFYDSCRYPTPLLVPSEMPVADDFKTSTKTYKDMDDLFEILKNLIIKKSELNNLQKYAVENSLKFTPEKLQTDFLNKIKEL